MTNQLARLPDWDFKCAFEENQPQPFKIEEVLEVKACIPGHNDEDSWYWIVELKDGRFYLVDAACDYTGWDCHSRCDCFLASSAEDAAERVVEQYSTRRIKEQLLNQLRGEQPFGLEIKPAALSKEKNDESK